MAQEEEISAGKAMADLKGQLIHACTSSTKLPFRIVTALRSFIKPESYKAKEYFKKLADIKKDKIEYVHFPEEHDVSDTKEPTNILWGLLIVLLSMETTHFAESQKLGT